MNIKAFQQEMNMRILSRKVDALIEKVEASAPWIVVVGVMILIIKNITL